MKDNACGECTACCRVYAVPELKKPAGPWCQHCNVGVGCKIYDHRPKLCVDFKCLWLESRGRDNDMEHLADELRPDRCKVVFSPTTDPEIMAGITMPGAPDAWKRPLVRELINRMIDGGMRVVVGQPGTLRKLMIEKHGMRVVELTEPDENGMQWGQS